LTVHNLTSSPVYGTAAAAVLDGRLAEVAAALRAGADRRQDWLVWISCVSF